MKIKIDNLINKNQCAMLKINNCKKKNFIGISDRL